MDFAALFSRIKKLILSPASEWDVISGESVDIQRLYINYIGPLIIAGALASAIGISVIGINLGGGVIRVPAGEALGQAVLQIILGGLGVYVMSLVINALAPSFGATPDANQAFKVAAYAPTAAWVSSVLTIVPLLSIISMIGGFYSLYLLYVGLPKLMKPAADKGTVYTLVVLGVMIVCSILIALLSGMMVPSMSTGL